jgi:hypothetical protein
MAMRGALAMRDALAMLFPSATEREPSAFRWPRNVNQGGAALRPLP